MKPRAALGALGLVLAACTLEPTPTAITPAGTGANTPSATTAATGASTTLASATSAATASTASSASANAEPRDECARDADCPASGPNHDMQNACCIQPGGPGVAPHLGCQWVQSKRPCARPCATDADCHGRSCRPYGESARLKWCG